MGSGLRRELFGHLIGVLERRVVEYLAVRERRCDVFGDHGADECDSDLSKVKFVLSQELSPHH